MTVEPMRMLALADQWGRVARDLRVSLTDRCNLRCSYCMPPEGLDWLPTAQTLTDAEVKRLINIAVSLLGIEEIRFTGGEPLLRRGLLDIAAYARSLRTRSGARPELALTTNALGLDKKASALAEAGISRVNISLDTVDRELYARISGRDRLPDVFAGIDAARAAGLTPIKINAVAMRGVNDAGLPDVLRYCLQAGTQLRIIEHMPLGPRHTWRREAMMTQEDVLELLSAEFELSPLPRVDESAPASLWAVAPGRDHPAGTVGVIASVSKPFCGNCDRTRLTADGQIRTCLFAREETDLRGPMRAGASDEELARIWAGATWKKKPGHGIDDPSFVQPDRYMSEIGG
ncbi:GTP 3',8-cyclase MoaA [Trueperella bialowiezensis]|uniref:GTP 3',8-cyclase n=1 Tax=Trueperella bialowiezensis TaxID=312285 RepID=A0A3S4VAE4_9ACTO|nr:GTP 3',8-cyclase MoaA [Trueperella bialowiezensis]VEI13170.1 Probable molybdopterin cofactor synthesis protein A [Trueperella bialowiezensis]